MNIIKGNKISRKIDFFFKQLRRRVTRKHEITVFGTNNNEIQTAFIINLDRQKNRWRHFEKEAKFQKLTGNKSLFDYCQRISAIDGKDIELKFFSSNLIETLYPLSDQYYVDPDPRLLPIIRNKNVQISLTKEEIAVGLSHVKVWKKIIEKELDYALILEDDVFFKKDFAIAINQIWQELPNNRIDGYKFDLLYLSFKEVDRGLEKQNFTRNILKPLRGLWWFSGYVLSYTGAKKLLKELPIRGPVDLWINHKFSLLDVYSSKKSIITQRLDLKSDNNYSILPILSQVGIQSDKTHLLLEQKKGRNPVFVISYNDFYSEFFGETLSLLGYRCCINRWGEFTQRIDKIISKNETLLFDAYAGFNSILFHYTEIKKLYPNAVFIIEDPFTRKNGELVINSVEQEVLKSALKYFSNNTQYSLILNLNEIKNWSIICDFLNCEIPKFSTPKIKQCFESPVRLR
ncbi:MAG: glycosyltransferase family 25 protein, partial [bacterium]